MSKFRQLHILTSYAAANLNRDDLGRPKTVTVGNTLRLRVSSQSLKRAWRAGPVFQEALAGRVGTRTKELGENVFLALTMGRPLNEVLAGSKEPGALAALKDKPARAIAQKIAGVFGALKKDDGTMSGLHIEQLAHVSPAEIAAVAELTETCRASGTEPGDEELELLRRENMAADIALFGRMLAAKRSFGIEAAAQVAHAFTVHSVAVEDDFFTAVDDLNRDESGAGHMGVAEFGAGLFYTYICVDHDLLLENLGGDAALAAKAIAALCRSACTVSPTGKQNSFASRAYASYCLAEKGDAQPRSLSAAFLKGLDKPGKDILEKAVERLTETKQGFDAVYGDAPVSLSFNAAKREGSLDAVCAFVAE